MPLQEGAWLEDQQQQPEERDDNMENGNLLEVQQQELEYETDEEEIQTPEGRRKKRKVISPLGETLREADLGSSLLLSPPPTGDWSVAVEHTDTITNCDTFPMISMSS